MGQALAGMRESEQRELGLGALALDCLGPRRLRRGRHRSLRAQIAALGQQLTKQRRDRIAIASQLFAHPRRRFRRFAESHPRGQRRESALVGREAMGLHAGHHLQLVFDVAQKQIGVKQLARPLRREISERAQTFERRRGLRTAQAHVAAAVDQHQRLNDKLELADSAAPELDIALHQLRRAQLVFDLPLHRAQLAHRVEVEIAPIDEARQLGRESLAHFDRARHRTRAQQRGALPGLTEALVKVERACERGRQRRTPPARTQPQIEPETARRKQIADHRTDPRRRLAVPPSASDGDSKIYDQVEIGTEIEFLDPKLAHREHAKPARQLGPRLPAIRDATLKAARIHSSASRDIAAIVSLTLNRPTRSAIAISRKWRLLKAASARPASSRLPRLEPRRSGAYRATNPRDRARAPRKDQAIPPPAGRTRRHQFRGPQAKHQLRWQSSAPRAPDSAARAIARRA